MDGSPSANGVLTLILEHSDSYARSRIAYVVLIMHWMHLPRGKGSECLDCCTPATLTKGKQDHPTGDRSAVRVRYVPM